MFSHYPIPDINIVILVVLPPDCVRRAIASEVIDGSGRHSALRLKRQALQTVTANLKQRASDFGGSSGKQSTWLMDAIS